MAAGLTKYEPSHVAEASIAAEEHSRKKPREQKEAHVRGVYGDRKHL